MPNIAAKQEVIQEIRNKVEKAKSMVLVDARGLSVSDDTKLRKVLREADVDYKVYKNTMINFAIKDTGCEGLAQYLEGPTAIAFSYDEATKGANLINKLMKDMPKLEFKAGVVDGVVYDAQGMTVIADIPSREVLLSRLLGSFKSPISSFARVLNALAEEKGSGGKPEAATEPETEAVS
ncbi:MAG: 50S ribosomal protein L10 [Defluviitaleaceae bacterium]|nr:50S ribosomal protein L10 [Defluviitaleaceae bacterium]